MIRLLFLTLLLPLSSMAQEDNPDVLPVKKLSLELKKIAPGSIQFPFSAIRIIDNRFDTSKLGFTGNYGIRRFKKRSGRKLVLEGGVARALENYYNEYYQHSFSKTGMQLLVVLKKLWLSGTDDDAHEMDIVKREKYRTFLHCKLEFYLKKEERYYPFKRTDTVINGVTYWEAVHEQSQMAGWNDVFKMILNGLIETVDFDAASKMTERLPQKSMADIQRFNTSFYNIPVLKDTIIAKGIFVTFEEFKNNQPSITKFVEKEIKIKGGRKENYLEDEAGNRITQYWGYNTGNNRVKVGKYGNDLLFRKNQTFEYFATYQSLEVNRSLMPISGTYKDYEYWIPYQIDMETGNVY